jgi:hypothetical protein
MISQITPQTIQQMDPISNALSSLSASSLSALVANLDEMVRKDLEAFRNIFFWRLVAATVAVVVGVVLEEAQEWMPAVEKILRLDPITEYRWAKHLVKLGWILIVIGVAGEGLFEVYVSRADALLGAFDNILLTEARKEASDAVLGAATANIRVAEAQRQTAELRKEAEDERLARVKIEAAVAWRSLSNQQKRDIGATLASFSSKAEAAIWFDASSTEAETFADDIAEVLRSSHITTTAPGGSLSARQGGKWNEEIKSPDTRGVVIQSTKSPVAIEFARVLIEALNDRGFSTKRQTEPPFNEKTLDPVISIFVGPRPNGPQGEYKLQAERDAAAKKK